jgi:CelD/BcsL family acetyltransferase involved in cellulose biosynthesis
LKVRIADGLDGLRSLKSEWDRLHAAGNGSLFQSHAWMEAWAEAIEGQNQGEIRILLVGDQYIVPLLVQRRLGIRRLRWLGVEVTDYCDLVGAGEEHELEASIRAHLPAADLIELRQMRTGSLASRTLGAAIEAGRQSCPYITIAEAEPPRDILNAERRAGALMHRVAADDAERAEVVDFVVAQKRTALVRQSVDTTEFDRRVTPFMRRLPMLDYPNGARPYFSSLSLDGQTIAAQVGFIEAGALLYYLPAYDTAFRQHSPGHLLLLCLLREAQSLGLATIDLLRGQEPYKFKWTSKQRPLAAAEWATSLRGRAFALARRFRV